MDDLPMSMRTKVVMSAVDKQKFEAESGDEWPSDEKATKHIMVGADWWVYEVDDIPLSHRLCVNRFGRPSLQEKTLPTPSDNKCGLRMLPCAAPRCPHAVVQHLKHLLVTKSPHLHRLLQKHVQSLESEVEACLNDAHQQRCLKDKLAMAKQEQDAVMSEYNAKKSNSKERVINLDDKSDEWFGETPEARRHLCWRVHNQCIFGHSLSACECDKGVDVWRRAPDSPCLWRHDYGNCRCHRPVLRYGQDEAIFHSSLVASAYWRYKKRIKMLSKSKGTACMVSAIVDELLGFGLPLTDQQLELINANRVDQVSAVTGKKKLPLQRSPGLVSICPGKSGRWDLRALQMQAEDIQDCYDVVASDYQIVGSYDNSCAHSQKQTDGLLVAQMNKNIGGTQRCLRDTTIVEGCLDSHPANMYKDVDGNYLPTTTPAPPDAVTVEDCKLDIGDVQQGVFHPDQVWLHQVTNGEWCVSRRPVDVSDDNCCYVRSTPGIRRGLFDGDLRWKSISEGDRMRHMSIRDLGEGRIQITGAIGRQARFANGTYEIFDNSRPDGNSTAAANATGAPEAHAPPESPEAHTPPESPVLETTTTHPTGVPEWCVAGAPVSAWLPNAGGSQWKTVVLDVFTNRRGAVMITVKKPDGMEKSHPDYEFSGRGDDEITMPIIRTSY